AQVARCRAWAWKCPSGACVECAATYSACWPVSSSAGDAGRVVGGVRGAFRRAAHGTPAGVVGVTAQAVRDLVLRLVALCLSPACGTFALPPFTVAASTPGFHVAVPGAVPLRRDVRHAPSVAVRHRVKRVAARPPSASYDIYTRVRARRPTPHPTSGRTTAAPA